MNLSSRFSLLGKGIYLRPRQTSIRSRVTYGVIVLVIVTVILGGLPAIGIAWFQLDRQLRFHVQDTQLATQALYVAEQEQLLKLAALVAERPTLCTLLRSDDVEQLTGYLETLRQETAADALVVVSGGQQIIVSSRADVPTPDTLLDDRQLPFTDFILLENPPQLGIFSISELGAATSCGQDTTGQVIVLQVLDSDFMRQLAEHTGLEQSLIIGENRVATSLDNAPDWPLNPEAAELVIRTQTSCCTTGASEEKTYYVGLVPLVDHQGSVIALSETALPRDAIHRNMIYAITLMFGTSVLVAAGSAILATVLARRVTQPLSALSEAARQMSVGALETPIPIQSGYIEIDELASQLDRSRRHLAQIIQVTRRELKRITLLLGATREGMITLDENGLVTWFNLEARQILGYSAADLWRKHCDQVFRPAPGEAASLNQIFQPPERQLPPARLTILDAYDHPITLAVSTSWLEYDLPREPRRERILLIREVSEEEAINRLRTEFLANVAHEFRTPLTGISAATELLEDESSSLTPEEVTSLANTVRLSATHLQTLVDNLLESVLIDADCFRLRRRPFTLADELRIATEMMSPLLRRRQQQLSVEVPDNLPTLWADPDRLRQAVVNLLQNASKFSPKGTQITLAVEVENSWITLAVLDAGPGLPAERFSNLFDRFWVGDQPRGAQYGIGFGLPIVKAIVDAHGGRVGAENRAEGGARVWFSLPIRLDEDSHNGRFRVEGNLS